MTGSAGPDVLDPGHPLHNAEAGMHPLPADVREIGAVIRAAQRCCTDYPYLVERYGARGEAFTRSDDGYLATLPDHPQSYVDDQVAWLVRTLACRGMPGWLMESHLPVLCQELCAAIPERAASYAKLNRAADMLRAGRQAWIAQTEFDALVAAFRSEAGPGLVGAGELLVAAVCDECNGHGGAVASLTDWLADPDRFSAQWRAACATALMRARAIADKGTGASL